MTVTVAITIVHVLQQDSVAAASRCPLVHTGAGVGRYLLLDLPGEVDHHLVHRVHVRRQRLHPAREGRRR